MIKFLRLAYQSQRSPFVPVAEYGLTEFAETVRQVAPGSVALIGTGSPFPQLATRTRGRISRRRRTLTSFRALALGIISSPTTQFLT